MLTASQPRRDDAAPLEKPQGMTTDTRERVADLARRFLQETVFASRQATHAYSPDGAQGCGLGARPAIPPDFNARQGELLTGMLEAAAKSSEAVSFDDVRACCADWIKVQDGLDRKRNHFLKDFRQANGFDRKAYSAEVEAAFKAGLDDVNQDNRRRLDAHAEQLVAILER